jgi:hypothetical protein
MYIVWGSRFYGKVDEVPGLCHVATQFGHVYYIPLIPVGTYAVIAEQGDNFQGVPLPLSGKSVLTAWLRAGLVLGGAAALIASAVYFSLPEFVPGTIFLLLGVLGLGLFYGSYRWSFLTQASYERALQIASILEISKEGMLMLEIAYGRLNADQAMVELQRYQESRTNPFSDD